MVLHENLVTVSCFTYLPSERKVSILGFFFKKKTTNFI